MGHPLEAPLGPSQMERQFLNCSTPLISCAHPDVGALYLGHWMGFLPDPKAWVDGANKRSFVTSHLNTVS